MSVNHPKTEREWELRKASLDNEALREFGKICIVATVVLIVVIFGWFFYMAWISTATA